MASSTARSSGAAEHTVPNRWVVSLAFSNTGLSGSAVTGNAWEKRHNPKLLKLCTKLLEEQARGLLLNEVGSMSDLVTVPGRERLEEVLTSAFEMTGVADHGPPQIFLEQ